VPPHLHRRALFADDRLRALVDAARGTTEMAPITDRNDSPSVVIKNPGAHEGLTDLPWHVDCGLGGHPILCPAINLGIQLDAARADNGQLHFLAGSHRTTAFHLTPDVLADDAYPTVAITTRPGDVTLHLGDTLHWAPAPRAAIGPGRRALYLSWGNPVQFDVLEPRTGYNDLVLRSGQGNRVRTVDEQLTTG
jgi:ectoine hydroxylase-related dioxygenase (phytanoyl-CoA dioxygenase family)